MSGPDSKREALANHRRQLAQLEEQRRKRASGTARQNDSVQGPGLASRIGSSASQLGWDLVGGAPSSATSSLASAWASTQKAGPSSAAASGAGAGAGSVGQSLASRALWEFGSTRVDGAAADEELGDWSRTPDSALATPSAPGEKGSGTGQWKGQFDTVWDGRSEAEDLSYRGTANGAHNHSDDSQGDGADVVSLLRNPAFSPDSGSLHEDIAVSRETEQTSAANLFSDADLDPSERDLAQRMRASLALGDPTQTQQVPGVGSSQDQLGARTARSDPSAPYQLYPNTEILHLPTVPHTVALRPAQSTHQTFSSASQRREWYEAWLSEWSDVLAGYAEEVWAPEAWEAGAVDRAREAVREVQGQRGWWEDGVAVRRLRAVLGHMGGGGVGVETGVLEDRWKAVGDKGKGRARESEMGGEAKFRCPDCGALYGSEGHVVVHERWVRESGATSRVEMELGRQTRDVEGRWGRGELDRDS